MHARNVSLVLDLNTGLVSPQFHVVHDATFKTVQNDRSQYQWSIKAGFEQSNPITKTKSSTVSATNKRKRVTQSLTSNTKKSSKTISSSEGAHTSNKTISSSEDDATKTQNKTNPSSEDDATEKPSISENTTNTTQPSEGNQLHTNIMGRSQSHEHVQQRKSQSRHKPVERLLMAMRAEMTPASEGAILLALNFSRP